MCLKCFKVLRQTGDYCLPRVHHISRQDVNEMPDWEIQPKKHKYEVGERVLVRPAIIDGIWAKASCRKTVPATVVFVHPDDRFIVSGVRFVLWRDGICDTRKFFNSKSSEFGVGVK